LDNDQFCLDEQATIKQKMSFANSLIDISFISECQINLIPYNLESPKFSRHAGLDPISRLRNFLTRPQREQARLQGGRERHWIHAFAGIDLNLEP
jgi:hypothetical protein